MMRSVRPAALFLNLAMLGLACALATSCTRTTVELTPEPAPGPATASASTKRLVPGEPYHPSNDPLVNPPEMFVPMPADASAVGWDETIVRNLEATPRTVNPLFMSSTVEFYFAENLFRGLFTFNSKMEWMVDETAVEHFEEAPDHMSSTVTIKPGLTWQDGAPWAAEDVCYSWKTILDERVPVEAVRSGTEEIADCQVLAPLQAKFVYKRALPTNKWNILFPIIPKHLFEKDQAKNPDLRSGDYYIGLNHDIVGSGPYKLVEWVENEKFVFERWDGYQGDRPRFKRVVFRIIQDPNNMLLSFNAGDIDEFRLIPQQFATQCLPGSDFDKAGGSKLHATEWTQEFVGYNMNGSNPFFTDKRVRQAMTHACDIERMNRDIAYNLYTPGKGFFHPDSWMFEPTIQPLGFDLAKAGALLDEAGWVIDEAREGWRHKVIDGKPVKFEFTCLVRTGSATGPQVAAIFTEDLKSIGVQMNTQTIDFATIQERTRKHEYQAYMGAWGTGTDPDTSWNLWHSDQYDPSGDSGRNYGGYKNPRVDELYELGRQEFDDAKRKLLYQEAGKHIYEDQPYTWLWNRGTLWAIHDRISGVTTSPRGVFNFDPAERGWWVPVGKVRQPRAVPTP